jgi:Tol biopolymer transport system component
MDDPRSVIERSLARVGSESYTLESFYRRRDRERRRQRIVAGVVGLSIALGIVVAGSILRSAPENPPAGTKGTPILREGEVLQVGGDGVTLVATDPATGHQRVLLRCADCSYIPEVAPNSEGGAALSSEGGWIAYEACGDDGGGGGACDTAGPGVGVWMVGADGPPIRVTSSGSGWNGWAWAWSPATEQLAFVTERSGLAELVLLDPATDERTSVTTDAEIATLSWSPDGTEIAIASGYSGVYVVELATGELTSIYPDGTVNEDLSWSPDGTRLVFYDYDFSSDRERIIVVNADGSDRRVLVDEGNPHGPGAPGWSPDGTKIAYVRTPQESGSTRDLSFEVWVIGADGSDATRLFHGDCCIGRGFPNPSVGDWSDPVWSADGSRIAFFDDVDVPFGSQLVVNADGSGSPKVVDDVVVDRWIQG